MKKYALLLALAFSTSAMAAVDYTAQPVQRNRDGSIYRSAAATSAFRATTVCPATGLQSRAGCDGYVVDHIWPLKCARNEWERRLFDTPSNMQYQTIADALAKDKTEGAACVKKAASQVAAAGLIQ